MHGFQMEPVTTPNGQPKAQDRMDPQIIGSFLRVLASPDAPVEPASVLYVPVHSVLRVIVNNACVFVETTDERSYLAAGEYGNDFEADEARRSLLVTLAGDSQPG